MQSSDVVAFITGTATAYEQTFSWKKAQGSIGVREGNHINIHLMNAFSNYLF